MKAGMILLLVICVAAIADQSEAHKKYINPGVLSPCNRPNPPPGCQASNVRNKPRTPANKYQRGCPLIKRCRRELTSQ
ncbi:unnamed protein product [Cochlearia groenlandica]